MLKKSLLLVSFCSFLTLQAHSGGHEKDISGDDRQVTRTGFYKLTQKDGEVRTEIGLWKPHGSSSFKLSLSQYRLSKLNFIATNLEITKQAQKKMGLHVSKKDREKERQKELENTFIRVMLFDRSSVSDVKVEKKKVSTATIRSGLLTTPLRDLISQQSIDSLYRSILKEVNLERGSTGQPQKITMKELYEILPDTLAFQDFLGDPSTLFTVKAPNSKTVPLFKSEFSSIEGQFQKTLAGTHTMGLKVNLAKGDYVSFSIDPLNCLVQDEDITDRLARIITLGIDTNDKFKAALVNKKMADLLGTQGYKQFMHSLTTKGFKSKDSTALDYSDLTADLTLEQFCQRLDAKLSKATLVTWALNK